MRLYVGGIPYQTTDQDLSDLFQQAGNVLNATVIIDRATGRSKGFGFVEMENDQDAQSAISRFNGSQMGNRTITVNEARERPSNGGGGGGSRGGYGNRGGDRDRRGGGGYRDRY